MGQGHLDPRKGTLPPTNLIFARRGERNLISVEFSSAVKQLQTDTHTIPRIRRNYHESIPQKDFFLFSALLYRASFTESERNLPIRFRSIFNQEVEIIE